MPPDHARRRHRRRRQRRQRPAVELRPLLALCGAELARRPMLPRAIQQHRRLILISLFSLFFQF